MLENDLLVAHLPLKRHITGNLHYSLEVALDIQEMRVDLAASLRWAARLGLHEGEVDHEEIKIGDGGPATEVILEAGSHAMFAAGKA